MKNAKRLPIELAAFAVLVIALIGCSSQNKSTADDLPVVDLTQRIEVDSSSPSAKAMVNIQGIITAVSENGMNFQLDNKQWVVVTDETKIGISGPTAAPREEQFFEPTFRVGNSIAGFALDNSSARVTAYAIYTNWNWKNPTR